MIYLLDVNLLLALELREHESHQRTTKWIITAASQRSSFATCAITELGFLRILLQAFPNEFTLALGQKHLQYLKSAALVRTQFLPDGLDAQQLPVWVHWPKQIADGHLVALARAHGAVLATLDKGIPGSYLIPR